MQACHQVGTSTQIVSAQQDQCPGRGRSIAELEIHTSLGQGLMTLIRAEKTPSSVRALESHVNENSNSKVSIVSCHIRCKIRGFIASVVSRSKGKHLFSVIRDVFKSGS